MLKPFCTRALLKTGLNMLKSSSLWICRLRLKVADLINHLGSKIFAAAPRRLIHNVSTTCLITSGLSPPLPIILYPLLGLRPALPHRVPRLMKVPRTIAACRPHARLQPQPYLVASLASIVLRLKILLLELGRAGRLHLH